MYELTDNKFRMPGEWEEHSRTILEWPVRESMIWPENYEKIKNAYSQVIKAILEFERVSLIVNGDDLGSAKAHLKEEVDYLIIEHDDAWARDNIPTFGYDKEGKLAALNWRFNAWGEKYKPYDLDDLVGEKLLKAMNVKEISPPLVLEGGSIHSDGEGTILTTKQCLLNKNRNPQMSQDEIEKILYDYLGAKKIIWLEEGLDGDETDGHIDNIACFARPGVVVIQTCDDPEDPNHEIARKALDVLNDSVDAKGRKIQVIQIPQPPIRTYKGKRLTLSYLNFYFVNGGIILPVFGGDATGSDHKAIEMLSNVFPDRKVVAVDGLELVKEGGNVHCITQQVPCGMEGGYQ